MSRLGYWGRPWVIFDATVKQHRRWFTEFQRSRTWGHCPVRFVLDEEQGDMVTMMQRQLIEYYLGKEFRESNESKTIKAQRKPRKKHVPA
jgi:hypothetical protein